MVVCSVMGLVMSFIYANIRVAQRKTYYARAVLETAEINKAAELYLSDHGVYPPDAFRDIGPGLESYLPGNQWPKAPWPGSYYDWDNWADVDFPGQQIYQISIRFCDITKVNCHYPDAVWAQNFQPDSALYFCIAGLCRAHRAQPLTYPAACINCGQENNY